MNIIVLVIAYLLGSIPSAFILGKRKNIDVSKEGSGNVGTANALKLLGKKAAFITLLMDVGKGFLASYLGYFIVGTTEASYCCGLAAIVGHSWPVFLKGKGGKGLATAVGVLIFIEPFLLVPLLATILLVNTVTSYVALSAVATALLFPILMYYLDDIRGLIFGLLVMVLIIVNHWRNIRATFHEQEEKTNIVAGLFKGGK